MIANHFHHWLDWVEATYPKMLAEPNPVTNSICFTMPSFRDLFDLKAEPELMRPPYSQCWFEGIGPPSLNAMRAGTPTHTIGFYLVYAPPGEIEIDGNVRHIDGFFCQPFVRLSHIGKTHWSQYDRLFFDRTCARWEYQIEDGEDGKPVIPDGDMLDLTQGYCDWIGRFLTLLNCSNISRQENAPPSKLQISRTRRGKRPLFSYWTLNLDASERTARKESVGGTHASPRLHLRRGHPREHHPGKFCWVQPHAVGNKKLGVVHKDYAMGSPDQPAGKPHAD